MKKRVKTKYKFKATHLFVFAVIFFITSLLIVNNKKIIPKISPPNNKTAQENSQNKERIEVSGVKVANFINKSGEGKQQSFYTLEKTADYYIFYLPADELFYISITSYPFDEILTKAEQAFLDNLAITESEACKLNVDITTPSYANPDKAGEVYGLSFCSDNN